MTNLEAAGPSGVLATVHLLARVAVALFFIAAGYNHFRVPQTYVGIMPPYLPYPLELVYISGVFEILGGVGLLVPWTRTFSMWGLIALLIAVFPANIHMAMNGVPFGDFQPKPWQAWARLPLQFLLIALVYWVGKPLSGTTSSS